MCDVPSASGGEDYLNAPVQTLERNSRELLMVRLDPCQLMKLEISAYTLVAIDDFNEWDHRTDSQNVLFRR